MCVKNLRQCLTTPPRPRYAREPAPSTATTVPQIRRKERNEAHLYMNVNVVLEEAFDGHQGNDLYDPERAHYRVFRVRKQATVAELLDTLADSFRYPLRQLRPWPFSARSNQVRLLPLP